MQVLNQLDSKVFTDEEIQKINKEVNKLIKQGTSEKEAMSQVLSSLKGELETSLENVYKQLENE